jgi:F-type H+-transporting ATPase subunit b
LVKIDPALLFVQLLTFGLAVLILWRFFWKPLTRFMDARRRAIEQDIATAKQSRAAADGLEEEYRARLARIDEEAQAIMKRAADEGRSVKDEILREAQAEARRMLESTGRRIAEERVRAVRELRAETVSLAVLMAERAMKQTVDPKLQDRLVTEFARELAHD